MTFTLRVKGIKKVKIRKFRSRERVNKYILFLHFGRRGKHILFCCICSSSFFFGGSQHKGAVGENEKGITQRSPFQLCWAQRHQSVVFLHLENSASIQKTRKLEPILRKEWKNALSHPHSYSDKHNARIAPQPGRERFF